MKSQVKANPTLAGFRDGGTLEGYDVRRCTTDEAFASRKAKLQNISNPITASGLMSVKQEVDMFDRLMEFIGHKDRAGQSPTRQMVWPGVQIKKREEFDHLRVKAERWLPIILKTYIQQARSNPEWQAVSLVNASRMTEPIYNISSDKSFWVEPYARCLAAEGAFPPDLAAVAPFATEGPRFQIESLDKDREFAGIHPETGECHNFTVNRRDLPTDYFGMQRFPMRKRSVFGLGALNNVLQCAAAAIHDEMIKDPVFKLNVMSARFPVATYMITADASNFDFSASIIIELIAQMIGGELERYVMHTTRDMWVMVRGVNGRGNFMVRPKDEDHITQLMSGIALVAVTGKCGGLIGLCDSMAPMLKHKTDEEVFAIVRQGMNDTEPKLKDCVWRNQGDNKLWANTLGDKKFPESMYEGTSESFPLKRDDSPVMFGGAFHPDESDSSAARFYLLSSTYVEKTWCQERAPFSFFRPWPWHGWAQREANFLANCLAKDKAVVVEQDKILDSISPTLTKLRMERGRLEGIEVNKTVSANIGQLDPKEIQSRLDDLDMTIEDLVDDEWKLSSRDRVFFKNQLNNSTLSAQLSKACFNALVGGAFPE